MFQLRNYQFLNFVAVFKKYVCFCFRKLRNPLSVYCYNLLAGRTNACTLTCSLCLQRLRLISYQRVRNRFYYRNIIDHAGLHLGKDLYICNRCDYKTACRTFIRQHLHRIHNFIDVRKRYMELCLTYKNEIEMTITRCFGSDTDNSQEELQGMM